MKSFLNALYRFALYVILGAPLLTFGAYAFSAHWFFPQPIPREWTTSTFIRTLTDAHVQVGLWNGLWIAFLTSLLSLLIAFPAARVLGTQSFRGRQIAWLLFFLPTVVPPLAVGMGLNILFLQIGFAGTILGVVLAHIIPTLPYTIFTLSGAFSRYDENYEHQASVLGAKPIHILFNVTLRLMLPSLIIASLFAFLISWSQYLLTLLIGSGQVITLPILLFSAASGGDLPVIASLSLLFLAPPVLIIALTANQLNSHGAKIREQY